MSSACSSVNDEREALTAEGFAELMTNPRVMGEYTVQAADQWVAVWLALWAREGHLTGRQKLRLHEALAFLFMHAQACGVTAEAQDAAADSFDDEGKGRGVRHGASQTRRLLVRARLFIGRSVTGG